MKKLVATGLVGALCSLRTLMVMAMIAGASSLWAQNCVMSCPPSNPPVEISLSSDCVDVLTYQLLGVVLVGCPGEIIVDIMDNGMSIGNTITAQMIGHTYMVVVSHPASGQSCMSVIKVVDKQAPLLDCPANVTLNCSTDLDTYNALLPGDISDCSATTVYILDSLISSGQCVGPIVSQYLRKYIVVDAYNNADTCEQLISLQKATLASVGFPADLTGLLALPCSPLPDTSPVNTGYPTSNGVEIVNGTFCNLSAGYTNVVVPLCSGSYKILRTWTVVDWCNNNQTTTAMQVIEVLDKTPPVVIAPANFTASSGPSGCTADVIVPPAMISEDCATAWSVRMEGPYGTINSNGGLIAGLPVGIHRIIFKATSDCNLVGADTMYITVQDLLPPTPVCHQFLAIPVNQFGTTLVPATVFNAGSTDNCGHVFVKVKRMNTPEDVACFNPDNENNLFDDYIQFCCEDIANNNVMVIMRVYDLPPVPGPVSDIYLQGHFNDCMVQVEVQDKFAPQITCPSNLTISCEFPFTAGNLDVFGSIAFTEEDREQICIDDPGAPGPPGLDCIGLDGLATDNCQVEIEEADPVIEIGNCGTGTITRTFVATDAGGLQATCQQVITVINYDLFDENDITWPSDLTTFDICELNLLDPEDLELPYSEPILHDGACDMVGATHIDDVYTFSNADNACYKILRTWKVIDWCQLNTQTGGIWTHVQVIKVMNAIAPVIAPIADLDECSFDPQCGGLVIAFAASATDDCSAASSLTWKYFIDVDNNLSFDYTSAEIAGGNVAFSRNLPIGTHRIVYSVWDQCGNISTHEQLVNVNSCKPPSAKCIHGLSTSLMPMDTDGDGTADWGMVTVQAEMFNAGSDHPCGNPVTVAFSADPLDVSRVFDCSDLGINEIEVWAVDDRGLTDFCLTTIEIQDNSGVCPPEQGGTGIISGNITVPQAGALSGAMVYLEGSNLAGMPSGSNGHFVFPAMSLGGEYVVKPVKEGDARNGVTTLDMVKIQKHLLGIETFTTPYQYIAADINNSASVTAIDIIQLRKLILGFINEFPSNKSWRFIDKAHIFPDPLNPWLSAWPETYSIIPFSGSMNDVDFNAVKIGDLNHTANLQTGSGMIVPRGGQTCELEYTVIPQPDQKVFRVDIYLDDAVQYNALQFSFTWDQNGYKVLDWNPGESLTRDEVRMPEQAGENASLATFSIDGWQGKKMPLLTLWVEQTPAAMGYPFQLYLNPEPTQPLAFVNGSEEAFAVRLIDNKPTASMVQNRPNPFTDMTTILMDSQREEPATLRIYDLQGKLVLTRSINLEQGANEFVVRKSELKLSGIYMYEIESDFQYSTNRMIIVD